MLDQIKIDKQSAHGLTERHAQNDIVLSQQTECRRDGLERADADRVAGRADHVEVTAGDVERVDRVLDAAELERDVDQLVTRDGPDLGLLVVLRALDATVDGIRHRTRHLGKGESGVKHCNQLAIGRARHDRVDRDGLTIGTDDTIHVGQYLPVLVLVRQLVHLCDRELGHGRDVGVLRKGLRDGQLTSSGAVWVSFAVQQYGEVVGGGGVLREDTVEHTISARIVDLVADDRSSVRAKSNETFIPLRLDINRERGGILHKHCKASVSG